MLEVTATRARLGPDKIHREWKGNDGAKKLHPGFVECLRTASQAAARSVPGANARAALGAPLSRKAPGAAHGPETELYRGRGRRSPVEICAGGVGAICVGPGRVSRGGPPIPKHKAVCQPPWNLLARCPSAARTAAPPANAASILRAARRAPSPVGHGRWAAYCPRLPRTGGIRSMCRSFGCWCPRRAICGPRKGCVSPRIFCILDVAHSEGSWPSHPYRGPARRRWQVALGVHRGAQWSSCGTVLLEPPIQGAADRTERECGAEPVHTGLVTGPWRSGESRSGIRPQSVHHADR